MIQSASLRSPLHEAHQKLFASSSPDQPSQRDGADMDGAALPLAAALRLNASMASSPQIVQPAPGQQTISTEDWDSLFLAVETRLRQAVGEQLRPLPAMSGNSAVLAASLIQAIVLDCVDALDQLHAVLKQDRSQHTGP
jgi:hypothetical protein